MRSPSPLLIVPQLIKSYRRRSCDRCLSYPRYGQRIGIFAGSGVGKSTLLGMLARGTQTDVVVIGLIGERGREVREFLERDLTEDGRKKCVVVVATSDTPPLAASWLPRRPQLSPKLIVITARMLAPHGFGYPLCHGSTRGWFSCRLKSQRLEATHERVRHAAATRRTYRQ